MVKYNKETKSFSTEEVRTESVLEDIITFVGGFEGQMTYKDAKRVILNYFSKLGFNVNKLTDFITNLLRKQESYDSKFPDEPAGLDESLLASIAATISKEYGLPTYQKNYERWRSL